MDQTQRKISKIATKLPSSNLKQEDLKFVAELVQYVGVLNGRNNLSISIHDSFNSKYKVIISQMPSINFDDIRNIEMMNKRISSILIDLNRGYLIVESWKFGKEKKVAKKKRRRIDDEYTELPKSFSLKQIEENDNREIRDFNKLIQENKSINNYLDQIPNLFNNGVFEINTFNNSLKSFANNNGLDYVDITEISRRAINESNLIAVDNLHPSGIMYLEWAKKIFQVWID